MRQILFRIPSLFFSAIVAGCSTAKILPADSIGFTTDVDHNQLTSAYQQLESVPAGSSVKINLADGFGSNGAILIKRYFSASGKRCVIIDELESRLQRTLCRDVKGVVNIFDTSGTKGL